LAVCFVPSLAIMDQTLKNLRDPAHPYRVALNKLFHGRVNIVDKSMALAGTNFKPGDIEANLTVLVASNDFFRSANNSSLAVAIRSLRPLVARAIGWSPRHRPAPAARTIPCSA
jgi:type III restriction enzyme